MGGRENRGGEWKWGLEEGNAKWNGQKPRASKNSSDGWEPLPLLPALPDQSANGASDVSTSPDQAVSTGSKTRIERAATRDLVGDQVKTAKTLKCPFPGVIAIEPKRFLESGMKLVECPDCLRTRSLSPHNGVLQFPSHEKRKTHTPNTDQRWAMGETAWNVVGG